MAYDEQKKLSNENVNIKNKEIHHSSDYSQIQVSLLSDKYLNFLTCYDDTHSLKALKF